MKGAEVRMMISVGCQAMNGSPSLALSSLSGEQLCCFAVLNISGQSGTACTARVVD